VRSDASWKQQSTTRPSCLAEGEKGKDGGKMGKGWGKDGEGGQMKAVDKNNGRGSKLRMEEEGK
jgi:hypothetical protein